MAFFSSTPPQRELLLLHPFCKCSLHLHHFKSHSCSHDLTFSLPIHALQPGFSPLVVRAHVSHIDTKVASTNQEPSNNTLNHTTDRKSVSGFSHFRDKCKRVENKSVESNGSLLIGENNEKSARENGHSGGKLDFRQRRETGSGSSPMRSKDEILVRKVMDSIGRKVVSGKEVKQLKKGVNKELGKEKKEKGDKKSKVDSPGLMLRVGLDMCSKNGDVMGALQLYDSAQREGIEMGQYHYTVLLYLCSSAATGVVLPAKSGSGSRSLSTVDSSREVSTLNSKGSNKFGETCNADFRNIKSYSHLSKNGKPMDLDSVDLNTSRFLNDMIKKELEVEFPSGVGKPNCQVINGTVHLGGGDVDDLKSIKDGNNPQNYEIRVSEDFKKYALKRGFEIYEKMCLEKIPMNEASLTSIARMALAMGDGDMAFDMVKQMNELGINARLRSYGPSLSAFCNAGNIEKAFLVEQHMLEHGVYPEEPELEALLRVSIDVARGDKVYYLLHKLRTSVRQVSPSTADLLEKWFKSNAASKVGNIKWDERSVKEAIEKGGGGWHGEGWLGKGKWTVSRTSVGDDGICKCCGEKLATIDLDPIETEMFAESVASIAAQREKRSSFQRFQKWLDYYGPFEAVVDGANVGLFTQRNFKPSKVNTVVNGIRHLLPSKKWPLIVLHNRRVSGDNMDKPVNKALVEKWKNADALYATPTGSNDDWYWLYAAIRFKCLMVTNDEMRDHLFQLLGNDFFPKWKERHQVRFSFSDTGPVFHMPPPCSVVIQESEKGHWHIPIVSGHDYQEERTWLCVTRDKSPGGKLISAITPGEPRSSLQKKGSAGSGIQTKMQAKLPPLNHDHPDNISMVENLSQETYETLKNKFPRSVSLEYPTILWEIEAAEKLGGCIIDFEI